jgi:ATP-dependent Clp endopeptidase proteolytic subunit ClpP
MPPAKAAATREGAMKAKKWYRISAKADDTAEISIFGDIGGSFFSDGITAESFKADFDAVKDAKHINVLINSPGGNVFDGISIFNMLQKHREKVSVEVIGVAASAASLPALAGSSLKMHTGTFLMIHNPFAVAAGEAKDMRAMAGTLDKLTTEFVNIYEAHSDLSADDIRGYMDDTKWFTAEEAVDAGFADESIADEIAASISIDPNQYAYKHIPDGLRADAEEDRKPPETVRELEALLRDAGCSRKRSADIAAHGFGTDQRDSEPEDDQRDSEPPEEKTEPQNVIPYSTLLRMRENESFLKEG